ncbi:MAG: hypothetical protein A2909_00565 [Candidatus Tagabacteria bacterium RIFCSPLOWO2_01_FULL_39_11]|uniref:Penicillin-binding protein 2 n=1 Tax=Candidatus Tagabacteria bacterium RIFCSPLOWO2_01_FULL_39_11 TaxID=1802295 RepID=A0A1G2LN19_9BACT|nr:MAG: hypothetical protein A2909_00565 [Candidatus Tagabacteria bacterium RIFCSPLOWO2_01_FULL_39_11]
MKRKKIKQNEISLDEIFLDSKNIPGFDTERFEGRIEKALEKNIFLSANIIFMAVLFLIISRIFYLQIINGEKFELRAERNHLRNIPIFPPRGIIYDRNGENLVWNDIKKLGDPVSDSDLEFSNEIIERRYNGYFPGLSHIVGYVGLPSADDEKIIKDDEFLGLKNYKIGKAGVEKYYNEILTGEMGRKIVEVDSFGSLISENTQKGARETQPVFLTIDAKLNSKSHEILGKVAKERGFRGGAMVIMDVGTGGILALANFPEYDSQVLSKGDSYSDIEVFLNDVKKPFLNRTVSGLYPPGSIIKPLIAIAALDENIIKADEVLKTHGSISLPNPYFPDKKSVFYDWKNHGPVDMRRALAVSSNVYFYKVGGGYENIKGLGANAIKKYAEMFNFGAKTGIDLPSEQDGLVPNPELKSKFDLNDPVWRIGDTYNMSIGQGNFQVTPVQMAVFAAAIANNGIILKPKLLFSSESGSAPKDVFDAEKMNGEVIKKIDIDKKNFEVVREGMRLAVLEGTARALNGLGVSIAGKTGTAEIGSGKYVNSWFIGFFPYENPRFAISVVFEAGNAENLVGAVFATKEILEWMEINTPEYLE